MTGKLQCGHADIVAIQMVTYSVSPIEIKTQDLVIAIISYMISSNFKLDLHSKIVFHYECSIRVV